MKRTAMKPPVALKRKEFARSIRKDAGASTKPGRQCLARVEGLAPILYLADHSLASSKFPSC